MNLAEAKTWISTHAVIEQGYYLEGDDGQPNPHVTYCGKHAAAMARRYMRKTKIKHWSCAAWAGDDTASYCGIKTCGVTLDNGGLTHDGVRDVLGMREEHPMSFVANIDELELAQRSMTSTARSGALVNQYLWQLWLSQVLRNQRGVTKVQCLAFEAAWLAEHWDLALGILRRRNAKRSRTRRAT